MAEHGTYERWLTGCSCAPCGTAKPPRRRRSVSTPHGIAPSRVRAHEKPNGDMAVECWCREAIVFVTPSDVREGRTGSCGLPDCRPKVSA